MTRVYVPATLADLAEFLAAGSVPADADRYLAQDDSEEAEYDALAAAADDATALLGGVGRRVVVVAEVADPDAAFEVGRIAAVHADTVPVDPDAPHLPDLGWFATQEIPDLLA